MRVVDDFPDKANALLGEFVAGFVGVVDGPIHAVAESEFLCQAHGDVTHDLPITLGANVRDQGGVVLEINQGLHPRFQAEPPSKVGLFHMRLCDFEGWLRRATVIKANGGHRAHEEGPAR